MCDRLPMHVFSIITITIIWRAADLLLPLLLDTELNGEAELQSERQQLLSLQSAKASLPY